MPVNGPSRDPRTHLPAAIAAAAASDDSDTALEAILAAGVAAFSPTAAAIFLSDPDRPGLALAASHGIEEGSPLIADAQDPDHLFSEAATGRSAVSKARVVATAPAVLQDPSAAGAAVDLVSRLSLRSKP